MIDYGTNNEEAWKALCDAGGGKHDWKHDQLLGNCLNKYVCSKCLSTTVIDSSD